MCYETNYFKKKMSNDLGLKVFTGLRLGLVYHNTLNYRDTP